MRKTLKRKIDELVQQALDSDVVEIVKSRLIFVVIKAQYTCPYSGLRS